jgi:ribonuclease BN (tRNA processing enzyme)
MQLIVLGCYGPYPPAGQNCSGYLLRHNDTAVLIDCGNGVLSRLRYYSEPWDLSAVILSHLHSDHISDLMIMRYAWLMRQESTSPLQVFAPDEPREEFDRLAYKNLVETHAINDNSSIRIGGIQFHFSQGKHPYPSYFISAEAGGKKLVYSGDTAVFPGMAEAVRGADVFLCEASYLRADLDSGAGYHLAAYQAAEAAKEAGAGRLVLTHHHPERDPNLALDEAREVFPATELARAGSVYFL